MPITVRKFNAQVKDPESGDMIPAGLLSSDALGAINSAKTDAVAAVEGKQAVAEAAIELKGQTTLASIPDDYTALSNEVDDVKIQFDNTFLQKNVTGTITKQYWINPQSGISAKSNTWARTGLWNGHPTRSGLNLPDPNYVYRIHYYDATANISDGTGYLGYSGTVKSGIQYIPKTYNGSPVVKICTCFQRIDGANMTDADVETVSAKLISLYATDTTLLEAEYPADAKVTGNAIESLNNTIESLRTQTGAETLTLTATTGKYVNKNGGLSNGNYKNAYTATPFAVKAGDEVHFYGRGVDQNISMIYLCDSAGTTRKPVAVCYDSSAHDYSYIVRDDGYVGFSWHTDVTPTAYIVHDTLGGINQARFFSNADLSLKFQFGTISITSSGWDYNGANYRVRTASFWSLRLMRGDVVGLTDYTNAQIAVLAQLDDGSYVNFGWKTSDYVILENGNYKFMIGNLTDTDQNGHIAPLASLFFFRRRSSVEDVIKQVPYLTAKRNTGLRDPIFIPKKRRMIMHRGYMSQAPDNTIPAFTLAGQAGAWGIETDIRVSSDGYLVCFHDADVDDMTDGTGTLSAMTLEQIRALTIDAGSNIGQYPNLKIPTFAEYLEVCAKYGCVAVLDVGSNLSTDNIQTMASTIKAYGMQKSVLLVCNDTHQYAMFTRYLDDATTVYICFTSNNLQVRYNDAMFLGVGMAIEYSESLTAEVVRNIHSKGYPVIASLGNTTADINMLFDLGVDAVTTNNTPVPPAG